MWHNHSFSQRNKTTERAVRVGGQRKQRRGGECWSEFEKWAVGHIGGSSQKRGGQGPSVNYALEKVVKYSSLKVNMVSLLLTLNMFHNFSSASVANFEQVNVCWDSPGLFKQNIIRAIHS